MPSEIEWYLARLKARQKSHGGWGYNVLPNGRYVSVAIRRAVVLGSQPAWFQRGWHVRSKTSPIGCSTPKGPTAAGVIRDRLLPTDQPVPQEETPARCSPPVWAACTSAPICSAFGLRFRKRQVEADGTRTTRLPAALRRVDESGNAGGPKQFHPHPHELNQSSRHHEPRPRLDGKELQDRYRSKSVTTISTASNATKAFKKRSKAREDKSPKWYNDGYEFLAKTQAPDGSWSRLLRAECDTAFSILFLLRSTQKSIHAKLGEGMLLAGRGLPTNLSRANYTTGN